MRKTLTEATADLVADWLGLVSRGSRYLASIAVAMQNVIIEYRTFTRIERKQLTVEIEYDGGGAVNKINWIRLALCGINSERLYRAVQA